MNHLNISYLSETGSWVAAGQSDGTADFTFEDGAVKIALTFTAKAGHIEYQLSVDSSFPTRCQLALELDGENPWHFIPCCIHGHNNLSGGLAGQYPNLTHSNPEEVFSSPYWEFRADRASHPLSALMTDQETVGISIDPYSGNVDGEQIRNGLFSELPNRFGVTLGYENFPVTFENKKTPEHAGYLPATRDLFYSAQAKGRIFRSESWRLEGVAPMLENLYDAYAERAVFKSGYREAARGLLDAFIEQNWSDEFGHYTNQHDDQSGNGLVAWRGLYEIAWTGGVIQGFPFLVAEEVLDLSQDYFMRRKSGRQLMDEVAASLNPANGLFFDLVQEWNGSRLNGWWSGMKVAHDCHAAYTNGQALFYLFQAMSYLEEANLPVPVLWQDAALSVIDTFMQLQREDGNCGYTYYADRSEVKDWDGFAGCWVVAAFAAAYAYKKHPDYLRAASKGIEFYRKSVLACNAYGTPMDTWKSPDQEGNLAYVKAARLLHQSTDESEFLKMLEEGAHYEYLWRYGFKTVPDCPPLNQCKWNACGGSVTSVSNPHVHPMGLIITEDLFYLGTQSGNEYHRERAEDGLAWAMQCMELYPDMAGYGRYGVLTERFCPSDGLLTEAYLDGGPSSLWFSYNGWAAANVLEALLWRIRNKDEVIQSS